MGGMSDSDAFLVEPLANHGAGWCLLCNQAVEEDLVAHFQRKHPTPEQKVRTDILAWDDRIDRVVDTLQEIKAGDKPLDQIRSLDEVLKDLYIIRSRLGEKHRQNQRRAAADQKGR